MKKKIIIYCIVIVLIGTLIYSIYNIIVWKNENAQTVQIETKLNENIVVNEKKDGTSLIECAISSVLDNYNINFSKLKEINSETVGYVKVQNTDVASTVVKHRDNSYYLTHNFIKAYSTAGWIFADYRNNYDGNDKNLIIYGHARKDGSMFGTLKNILEENWYNGEDTKVLLIAPNHKYLFETFSVYVIEAEDYYITTQFKNDDEFYKFIVNLKGRSKKDFGIELNKEDRIITLSTCHTNNKYRIVLHAKLIEEK